MNHKISLFNKITLVLVFFLALNTANAQNVPGFDQDVSDNQSPPSAPIDDNLFKLTLFAIFYAGYSLNKHKNMLLN